MDVVTDPGRRFALSRASMRMHGYGVPGVDFDPADPNSTGQVMSFNVIPATTMLSGQEHSYCI